MVNSGSLTSVKSSLYSTTTSISESSSTTTPTSTFLATHDHLPDSRAWRSYLNSPHNFHLSPIETVFREKIRLDTENFWYKQSNTISGTIELAKPVSNMKRATEISSVKVFFEGHISLSDPSWDKMFICEENWLDGVQFPYNLKVGKTLSVPFQFLVPEIISESSPCGEILHQRLPPTSGNTSSCGYLFNNGPLETTHNNISNLQDQNICVTYFIKVLVTGKKDVTVDSSDLLLVSRRQVKVLPSYSAPSPYWSPPSLNSLDNKLYYSTSKYLSSDGEEKLFVPEIGLTNRDKLMVARSVRIAGVDLDIEIPLPKPLRINSKLHKHFPLEIMLTCSGNSIPEYDSISVKLFQNVSFSRQHTAPSHNLTLPQSKRGTKAPYLVFDSTEDTNSMSEGLCDYLPAYDEGGAIPESQDYTPARSTPTRLVTIKLPSSRITPLKLPPTFHSCHINVSYFLQIAFVTSTSTEKSKEAVEANVKGCFLQNISKINCPGISKTKPLHSVDINVPVVLLPEWSDCPDWAFTNQDILYGYAMNDMLPPYLDG